MKNYWIDGKAVLLTGVTSGIGRSLAIKLITKHNCKVLGIGRRQEAIDELKIELGDKAKNLEYKLFDVSKEDNWISLANELQSQNIQIDVLINNAGILPKFKNFNEVSPSEVENVIKINFLSSVYSISHLKPIIQKSQTPAIINVSSSASLCPLAGTTAYTASKSALKTFTEVLIEDYRKTMYIAYVCPGFTKTEIFRNQNVELEKIINLVCSSCEKNTNKILKKIVKRKKRIIVGKDAHLMDFFYRHFPRTFSHTCSWILKKSKIKLFQDVFKK